MSPRASVLCAFLFLSLASGLAAQPSPKAGWYASDPAGLALDPIGGPVASGYALRVSRDGDAERSELYKDGERVKAWIRSYRPNGSLSREAVEEGGALREELLYDALGRPELERILAPGGDVEEKRYEYSSGRLASSVTTRGGAVVSTMSYLYAPDGRLALARESAERSSGTSSAKSGGSASWRAGPEGLEIRSFDEKGRLVSIASYKGADLVGREDRLWKDGVLERASLALSDGTTVVTDYETAGPAAGKAARVTTGRDGAAPSEESFSYDAEGRLSASETSLQGRSTRIEYGYAEDGTLVSATTTSGGAVSLVVRYESLSARTEELYDDGTLFARVRYEDGRRVLEETIRGGIVVRSRSFK